jgi:hypothetical protein
MEPRAISKRDSRLNAGVGEISLISLLKLWKKEDPRSFDMGEASRYEARLVEALVDRRVRGLVSRLMPLIAGIEVDFCVIFLSLVGCWLMDVERRVDVYLEKKLIFQTTVAPT